MVRSREGKPGEYVLCVVYKGKCTHHLIAKNDDGFYAINKKTFGDYTKVNRVCQQRVLLALCHAVYDEFVADIAEFV